MTSSSRSQPLFDVERFRAADRRVAGAPEVPVATLVLGSTQPAELPFPEAVRARGVEVVRRRGGGGAVYLEPGDHLWMDAWIPRDDPLWTVDVSAAAQWVGAWWQRALTQLGVDASALVVHRGRSVPGELGELVCFAGRGPGEVFVGDHKLVGLSQWRSREGALFSSCAYVRWDPRPMVDLFDLDDPTRAALADDLATAGIGLLDVDTHADVGLGHLERLRDELLTSFPFFSFDSSGPAAAG